MTDRKYDRPSRFPPWFRGCFGILSDVSALLPLGVPCSNYSASNPAGSNNRQPGITDETFCVRQGPASCGVRQLSSPNFSGCLATARRGWTLRPDVILAEPQTSVPVPHGLQRTAQYVPSSSSALEKRPQYQNPHPPGRPPHSLRSPRGTVSSAMASSLRPLRLVVAPLTRPARLFSVTARAASDDSPAVKYNVFRRQNESDDTLRARLLCTSRLRTST